MPQATSAPKAGWIQGLARPIKRVSDANVRCAASLSEAARKGFVKFGEGVTEANVLELGLSNGLIQGVVNGWVAVLEEVPGAIRGFYDVLLDRPSKAAGSAPRPRKAPRGRR